MQNPTLSGLFLLIGPEIYDRAPLGIIIFSCVSLASSYYPRAEKNRLESAAAAAAEQRRVTCAALEPAGGAGGRNPIKFRAEREPTVGLYATVYSTNSRPSRSFRRRTGLGARRAACLYRFGGGVGDLLFRTSHKTTFSSGSSYPRRHDIRILAENRQFVNGPGIPRTMVVVRYSRQTVRKIILAKRRFVFNACYTPTAKRHETRVRFFR